MARAESGRRLAQIRIDPQQAVDHRQGHQRQLDLRERQHDAHLRVQELQGRGGETEIEQRVVDDSLATQDHDPCEGADHGARQQRQHDGENQQSAC